MVVKRIVESGVVFLTNRNKFLDRKMAIFLHEDDSVTQVTFFDKQILKVFSPQDCE